MISRLGRIGRRELRRAVRIYGAVALVLAALVIGFVSSASRASSRISHGVIDIAAPRPAPPRGPADPGVIPDPTATPPAPPQPAPVPVPEPEPSGDYTFLVRSSTGAPARFPCTTIRFLYNPTGQPYAAERDASDVAVSLGDALGRRVHYGGTTSLTPGQLASQSPAEPTVLVSWVPTEDDIEEPHQGGVVGLGGPFVDDGTILSGLATIVADAQLAPGFGQHSFGGVMLHEAGHAINLGHAASQIEQMYPSVVDDRPAGWGPGDRAGLAYLGRGCTASAEPATVAPHRLPIAVLLPSRHTTDSTSTPPRRYLS